jgi:hypothetical protein
MADDFLFISPEDAISGKALPSEMLHDMELLAQLPSDVSVDIAETLRQEGGILSEDRLEEIVTSRVDDQTVALRLAAIISSVRQEQVERTLALVDKWRKHNQERNSRYNDAWFDSLKSNFSTLIQDFKSVLLMRKAEHLLRILSNEVADVDIICDLRPVFDEEHSQIEGYVLVATLRLEYLLQNGQRSTFEVALTEQELKGLVDQGSDALQKIDIMKDTFEGLIKQVQ